MAVIYKLFDGDECVYVGQSKNVGTMYGRFSSHSKDKVFSSTSWEFVDDEDADRVENDMIQSLTPKYNAFIRKRDDFVTKSELVSMLGEVVDIILKNADDGSNGFSLGNTRRLHVVHAYKIKNELMQFAEEYSENFSAFRIERK